MEIFVANFDTDTDEEDLKALFSQYGRVTSVDIWENSSKGGYGFVHMPDGLEASEAIDGLNGRWRNGRKLKVNKKRERQDYED